MQALHTLTAVEVLARFAAGTLTAVALVDALIARIEAHDPQINALPVRRFAEARREAVEAGARRAEGTGGPLCGLPITIKENLNLTGFDSTMGLTARQGQPATEDAVVVRLLREAGAIVLGKSNVPQLLLAQETENPIWGLTRNPWDLGRSAGGSSGGEAAGIAAGYAPLGIGTDIGGSIRIPAHFCGVVGLKPTVDRWSTRGSQGASSGQEIVRAQIGPMARSTADLKLLFEVLKPADQAQLDPKVPPLPIGDSDVSLEGVRVGWYDDDGFLTPLPALRRAVAVARDALTEAGAVLVPISPPDRGEVLYTWLAAVSGDGGATISAKLAGDAPIAALKPSRQLQKLPAPARRAASALLKALGEPRLSRLLAEVGQKPGKQLWELAEARTAMARAELDAWNDAEVDLVVCPAHSVPAMPHHTSGDFVLGLGYLFRYSMFNFPAGTVPVTRVRPEETGQLSPTDRVEKRQAQIDTGSVGLPIGAQIVARPYREDLVLAAMAVVEAAAQAGQPDYPFTPIEPTL
jgi:fatty acid amide hydrolase